MRISSPSLGYRRTPKKRSSPVYGGNLQVKRKRSRIRLVLVPDSLAIRRSFQVEQYAEYQYEKPREQSQESEGDNCSLIMVLASGEWIH